jgi:hypothetical protein
MNQITDVTGYCAPKSDQINAEDLVGGPMDVTITKVYPGPKGQGAEVEIALKEAKPWRPCKTMVRLLALLWGKDPRAWVGRRLRLWRDPSVLWSGQAEGGIRVSHMSHIDRVHAPVLTESRGKRRPYEVHPMPAAAAAPSASAPTAGPCPMATALDEKGLTVENWDAYATAHDRTLYAAMTAKQRGAAAKWLRDGGSADVHEALATLGGL